MIVDKYGRVAGSIDLATLAQMYAQSDDAELKAHYQQVAAENGVDLGETTGTIAPATWGDQVIDAAEAPPKSGPGSGKDAWVDYAESLGVEVTDDMTRDDIIEAVEE